MSKIENEPPTVEDLLGKLSTEVGCLGILMQVLIDEVRTVKGKKRMDWKAFWVENFKAMGKL